jgi:hypothetical protein
MSEQRQKVRFTGKRTGRDSMPVKGVGVIEVGDVIEVSAEDAERWTTELPMRDGEMKADFVKVGGPVTVTDENASARNEVQREKALETTAEYAPDVPMAHETRKDTGTVEEYAEVVAKTDEAIAESGKDDGGKAKGKSKS